MCIYLSLEVNQISSNQACDATLTVVVFLYLT